MEARGPLVSTDEAIYFLNVAVIAGTLLGLSFVTLAFFLSDLLKRYEETALPAFRVADPSESLLGVPLVSPESMTDLQLLDGDPLIVFMAFSVAVTWNLFLLPLVIGLTAAWGVLGWRYWRRRCCVGFLY